MKQFPVFSQNGKIKVYWNIIVLIAVLVFSMVFSYRLTFHGYKSDMLYWVLIGIFALDILFNFNTAIKRKLNLHTDRKSIAHLYLKGWFTVDLIIALPFELIIIALFGMPVESRGGHILLIVLLLITTFKLVKVRKITKSLQEDLRINPGAMRLIVFGIWFSQAVHYMALGWIIIGAGELNKIAIDEYIRALYWCITTVATIGYGDYYPNHDSNIQIIYTIIVQIFGVGMYGYIIGNVSGLITNLDVARTNFLKKIEEISIFLRNKKIPMEMQENILNYYYYLWEKKKSYSNDSPIDELPHSLSMEIMLYLNRDMIMKVDLFKNAADLFVREAIQLLEPMVFIPNDYIIRQGEYGDCMFFLSTGEAEVLVNGQRIAVLGPGSPFGETALIIGEKRNASIHTLTYCEVYRLSRTDFESLRSRFPEFNEQISQLVEKRTNKNLHQKD